MKKATLLGLGEGWNGIGGVSPLAASRAAGEVEDLEPGTPPLLLSSE